MGSNILKNCSNYPSSEKRQQKHFKNLKKFIRKLQYLRIDCGGYEKQKMK